MKKRCFLLLFFLNTLFVFSQVGIGTTSPDVSSILDLNSTSKGFLLPRLTLLERDGITTPANGLLIFNTDANEIQINLGTTLLPVWASPGSLAFSNGLTLAGGTVKLGGTLTANTIIDNNNNNLTCTTGTGRLIADGNFETTGAVYAKVRKITALPIVWQADDYIMNITVANAQNIALPDPTLNAGRVILIRNNSVQAGASGSYAYITHIPVNNGSVLASRAQMLVSDGISWFIVAGL